MSYCCPTCAERENSAQQMGEPPLDYLLAKVQLLNKVALTQLEAGETGEAIKNIDRMIKTLHRIGITNV